jgi:hypothetical protein
MPRRVLIVEAAREAARVQHIGTAIVAQAEPGPEQKALLRHGQPPGAHVIHGR